VLITAQDHVYLTDFGLSKRVAADSEATRTGMVLGTLDYVAPEQIRGQDVGPFTDVYSLGCMAVHLLTGRVAYPVETEEGKLWAHFSEPPPLPSGRVPELGKRFDALVARALAKRPEDRFATAGELGEAMLAAAGTTAPARRRPARAPALRSETRDLLVTAATEPFNVVLLALLLIAGALLDSLPLMIPLALLVYGAGIVRSMRDPATIERAKLRGRDG
jgi:serine/threonine protein kinase